MSKGLSVITALAYVIAAVVGTTSWDADARGGRAAARGLGAAAGAAASGPVLSQAELRQCLDMQDTLDDTTPKLKTTKEQLDADLEKLDKAAAAIKQRSESVDRTSQTAVDNFNAGIRRHQKQAEAYKAKVSAFNGQLADYRVKAAAFKETCAGKAYRESDMQAVMAQAPKK